MGGTYIFTVTCVTICTLHAFYSQSESLFRALHCLYTLCVLIRISSFSQQRLAHIYQPPSQKLQQKASSRPLDSGKTKEESENLKICKICCRVKPTRYYHCRQCGYCIFQMDHHCGWLNCCVAHYNANIYILALVNLVAMGLWGGCRQIIGMWTSSSVDKISHIAVFILCLFTVYESSRMLSGFIQSLRDNQTLVQTYKGVRGKSRKPLLQRLEEDVYGCSYKSLIFYYRLLVPVLVPTHSAAGNNVRNFRMEQEVEAVSPDAPVVREYQYADEYLYGVDSEEQQDQKPLQNRQKSN